MKNILKNNCYHNTKHALSYNYDNGSSYDSWRNTFLIFYRPTRGLVDLHLKESICNSKNAIRIGITYQINLRPDVI